jgi:IclR family transcriptional regulator, KDG regulon repressor
VIQQCGIALSFGEITEGTIGIAAPIFSWEEKVVGSITIVCLQEHFTDEQLDDLIESIKKAALKVSEELGWMGVT